MRLRIHQAFLIATAHMNDLRITSIPGEENKHLPALTKQETMRMIAPPCVTPFVAMPKKGKGFSHNPRKHR
jgi:hypothetical protein